MLSRYLTTLFLILFSLNSVFGQINCPENLPFTLQGNTEYCVGTPGSELSVPETYDSYEWLPTTETSQNVLLTAGNYELVVTHYTGCTDTLEFEVEQVSNPPQPVVTADGPLQFCAGESVTLSGPEGYPYYEWASGSVSRNITVYESGTYLISVEDWIGCVSSSNVVQVIVDPLPSAQFSPNLDVFDIQFDNLSVDATSYEWNFGDGNTSVDFEPNYIYTTAGYHQMYLVASNDCGNDTAFLELNSVNIEDASKTTLAVYPNPTEGIVNLRMDNVLGESSVITLTDLTGKTVAEPRRTSAGKLNTIVLDYSSVVPGFYILSLSSPTETFSLPIQIK